MAAQLKRKPVSEISSDGVAVSPVHPLTLLLRAIRSLFVGLAHLFDLLYPRRRVGTLVLIDGCYGEHEFGSQPLDRLEAALVLLHDVDPRRARLVERHVRRIEIRALSGHAGQWAHPFKRCRISLDVVMDHPTAVTASTIVHEMTHARLRERRIGYDTSIRTRVERICDLEEVRFLRRVPNAEQLVAGYEARLGREASSDEELDEHWRADLRERELSESTIERLIRLRAFLEPYLPD